MASSSELNLESLVHKNVRTKDGVDLGNIVSVDPERETSTDVGTTNVKSSEEGSITIMHGVIKKHSYKIPRHAIDEFDGAEVHLNVTKKEVEQQFLVKN